MRYRSIQTLRAVAALSVAAFHADLVLFDRFWFGTDLAFVISGFVVGTIGSAQTGATFFLKRLARIVPLYAIVTLLMCALSLIPGVFATFRFTIPDLVRSLAFLPYADAEGRLWPLFVPGWSLNLEILFYVVFALALAGRRPVPTSIAVLATLVGLGAVAGPTSAAATLWTSPILLEFCAGLVLAGARPKLGAAGGSALIAAGVAVFALAPALAHEFHAGKPLWMRPLVVGAAATAIVAGALSIERAGRWPGWTRLAEAIGERSYSIYVWNWLTIAAVHKAIGFGIVADAVALAATLLVAEASHRWLEFAAYRLLSDRLAAWKARRAAGPSHGRSAPETVWTFEARAPILAAAPAPEAAPVRDRGAPRT